MQAESLTYLFTSFNSTFRDVLEKRLTEIGLHSGQVFVLFSLWSSDGQSQADLVRSLAVSPPTINNMVARMTEKGFVSSKRDQMDARIMRVYLEPKGREIRSDVEETWQIVEQEVFGILTETERIMLTLLIKKVSENLL